MSDPALELAKNPAWPLLQRLNLRLESGDMTEQAWYDEVAAVIVPAYLAGSNPRAQSGSDGSVDDWTYKRGLLAEAVCRDGSFLDVGCANGYLMETLVQWCAQRGRTIEPYGLDIAPELVELTRRRVPAWSDRIFVGNGLTWQPTQRFDFVRTGLEYVPPRRQQDLIEHLLYQVVAPGGRLIIGVYNEEQRSVRSGPGLEDQVAAWGFRIAGRVLRPHLSNRRLSYRAFWLDR